MSAPSFSTNMTIFFIFFGLSLLDAIVSGNLIRAGFWLAIGLVFATAHLIGRRGQSGRRV